METLSFHASLVEEAVLKIQGKGITNSVGIIFRQVDRDKQEALVAQLHSAQDDQNIFHLLTVGIFPAVQAIKLESLPFLISSVPFALEEGAAADETPNFNMPLTFLQIDVQTGLIECFFDGIELTDEYGVIYRSNQPSEEQGNLKKILNSAAALLSSV